MKFDNGGADMFSIIIKYLNKDKCYEVGKDENFTYY